MNELALFAGAGGGILAGQMLGWRTICAVEWEAYPASVLAARQNDGHLEPFPIWDDVRTFDGTRWRGRVDVVSGGFPCQDISAAGKGAGIDGERSGMWMEMARIIGEVRPRFAFVENSPMLTSRGLGRVLGDLAALGFDAEWGVLGAADVGAPHQRDRIWVLGWDPNSQHVSPERQIQRWQATEPRGAGRREVVGAGEDAVAHANSQGLPKRLSQPRVDCGETGADQGQAAALCGWWLAEPNVGRVANGVAARVDRLKAIGNGQVPQCAAAAFIEGCRRLFA